MKVGPAPLQVCGRLLPENTHNTHPSSQHGKMFLRSHRVRHSLVLRKEHKKGAEVRSQNLHTRWKWKIVYWVWDLKTICSNMCKILVSSNCIYCLTEFFGLKILFPAEADPASPSDQPHCFRFFRRLNQLECSTGSSTSCGCDRTVAVSMHPLRTTNLFVSVTLAKPRSTIQSTTLRSFRL